MATFLVSPVKHRGISDGAVSFYNTLPPLMGKGKVIVSIISILVPFMGF